MRRRPPGRQLQRPLRQQLDQNTQTGPHRFDGDLTQWHVYGCELSDTGVKYYLDGKVVKELNGDNVKSNHVHRLGIQLDVGRTNRVSNDVRMFVDWVRVSKYKAVA